MNWPFQQRTYIPIRKNYQTHNSGSYQYLTLPAQASAPSHAASQTHINIEMRNTAKQAL